MMYSNPYAQYPVMAPLHAKHPLQYRWVMWYNAPPKKTGWLLQKIATFDSVEDFWCVINNIVPPSRLAIGGNYHLFKEGIQPEWEDKENEQGGKWVFDSGRQDNELFDNCWLWAMLALIGEFFEDCGDINGAVASPRIKGSLLSLWNKTSTDVDVCKRIGMQFKENLNCSNIPINYQVHQDSRKSNTSYCNAPIFTM